MSEQEFVPGTPVDPNTILVVREFHPDWLRFYPEIAQIVETQPEWREKRFAVHPASDLVSRKMLNMLAATTNEAMTTTKNYPHPIKDESGKIIAVVMHQTGGYQQYDSLYTYRGQR
jgi:hypothetical protein